MTPDGPRARIIGSGAVVRLALSGEVDVAARDEVAGAIEAALTWLDDHGTLSVELDDVEFMDVPALDVLIAGAKVAAQRHISVVLCGAEGAVARLLTVTRARERLRDISRAGRADSEMPDQQNGRGANSHRDGW